MIFRRAVLRLTITYTVALLALYGVFALSIYLYVSATFDFDPAAAGDSGIVSPEQGFATLREALAVSFGALLIVAPLASWVMARAALQPVKRTYELQQRFVDGASHELRTPLAVLQGEIELALGRPRTPTQYRQALELAYASTQTLITLTNDLLVLARSDAAELAAESGPVDVDAMVSAVACRDRASGSASVELLVGDGPVVVGSEELLGRAVGNLIDNAVKFTSADGCVSVSVTSEGSHVRIEVRDDGIGMRPEELRHARDRFWRADDARSRSGHGLGLSLVDAIAMAHGGSLHMESEAGSGTTAELILPVMTPRDARRR